MKHEITYLNGIPYDLTDSLVYRDEADGEELLNKNGDWFIYRFRAIPESGTGYLQVAEKTAMAWLIRRPWLTRSSNVQTLTA